MLPALILAVAAISRKVVAEKPWRRNSLAADLRIRSRDLWDFDTDPRASSGAPLRLGAWRKARSRWVFVAVRRGLPELDGARRIFFMPWARRPALIQQANTRTFESGAAIGSMPVHGDEHRSVVTRP